MYSFVIWVVLSQVQVRQVPWWNTSFYLSVLTRNPSDVVAPKLAMTLSQPLCSSWERALFLLLLGGTLACVV